LKILYVTTISNTVNAFLIPHIEFLIKSGHQVDVAFNCMQDADPKLIELGCKVYNINFSRSPLNRNNFSSYRNIKSLVLKERYDLVHTHTPIASFITRLACRNIKGLKLLYTAHGFHFFKGAPLKNWLIYYPLEKIAAKYTDAIITINEEDYKLAKSLKQKNSAYKIPGIGVNLEKFSQGDDSNKRRLRIEYGLKDDDFLLFYAAELNYNKHQDLLINGLSYLKFKKPSIKLLLAGEGPFLNRYRDQVKKLKLEQNVHFLGYREDIPNLLKMSDIAVSASRREGLPVNILEAMACGLPVISSNCRGNQDLVVNGENGYIIGINDVQGFVNSVESLYSSTNLRMKFGKENIDRVKQYSIHSSINKMAIIYSRFLPNVTKEK
jgi:glycosyltransferase EpsD